MAAEGRPRLRAAVGGLRRVLALDFQVGFPAGAVVLLIHWRWQPTGGAIYFLWIGDGRATPRLRLAARAPAPPLWVTLLCALRNCSASTISVTLTRARGARRRFQIAVSFFRFSGATPALPRLAALAAAGAGGGAQSRPSYAVAAEGRPRLRAAVGGLRRVLALDFQVGFPAGAVVLLIHWRWQPTGGAIYFLWIGDGRATPRLRLAARAPAPPLWVTLLCALRNCSASTISVTLTRARGARRRFQIAVSFFRFSGATPALPRLAALAAAGAGGGAQSRPSYAVAAEGRPRLRAAVGGLRRVLALDFQVGFPAGAVVLLIHWRWQPTGGAIYFL